MAQNSDTCCVLCRKSFENEVTGPLSTKDDVSAHQNCLLYASGIYSKNSPTYHDLFGFEIDDVIKEVQRGKRLRCSLCKNTGATVGCEKKACKHSYHYPCAVKAQAKLEEDECEGLYKLFCSKHNPSNENSGNSRKGIERNGKQPRTPIKKRTNSVIYSDDEPNVIDSIYAPVESDIDDIRPSPNRQSTPISEDESSDAEEAKNTEPVPSTKTSASNEYIDSDPDSQSLLTSEFRQENVPFTVLLDSGPSVTSETSSNPLSPSSPPQPVSVTCNTVHNDSSIIASQNISLCLDSLPPNSNDAESNCAFVKEPLFKKPRLVDYTSSTPSDMENIPCKPHRANGTCVHNCPLDLTSQTVDSNGPPPIDVSNNDSPSTDSLFWMECNEVGFTERIFTQLKHKLESLADRVQNKHATQQDYAVALRMLKASGMHQTILNQLEQDLKEQEEKLYRKREALNIAKEALKENQFV